MAALVDKDRFVKRASVIYDYWMDGKHESFNKVDAILICHGTEENDYCKSITLQNWLYGYELHDTITLMCKKQIYFLGSKKKAEFMKPIENDQAVGNLPPFKTIIRDKSDMDKSNFDTLIKSVRASGEGKVIGEFPKEKNVGVFMKGWRAALAGDGGNSFETMDLAVPMAVLLAPKDEMEIGLLKTASTASVALWNNHLRNELIGMVDEDRKTKHDKLSEGVEKALTDRKVVGAVSTENLETCFPAIIQSGGKYSMKFSAISEKTDVHFGAVTCTFGARYKLYCSGIARTMLVDPHPDVKNVYEALHAAEQSVIDALKPGVIIREAYEAGLKTFKSQAPDFVGNLTKSFGFATGIEFRESALPISGKCVEKVADGMAFIVHMGVSDVPNRSSKDEAGKTLSLVVADTVLVKPDGVPNDVLTDAAKRRYKSLAIMFATDDTAKSKEEEENKENIDERLRRGKRTGIVLADKIRNKETNEEKRREHQRKLMVEMNAKALARLSKAEEAKDDQQVKKNSVSYRSSSSIPNEKEVKSLQVYVDRKNESVIMPIFGVSIPFHISMIKNISQSVEGQYTYLRINFFHPGGGVGKETIVYPNPLATFVKEITYRSSNQKEPGELNAPSSNLNTAFRLIKEVQKRFKTREAEEREKEGVVKQDKLVLSQNKGNPRLKDLFIRPNIISKRVAGTLEAHTNGFRYNSVRGDKVDILFNNIKHSYFQPCDKELTILLHFHLKDPIIFGKKQHRDIQVFAEVGEVTTDLGKYHNMQDRDDVYAEQAERELRHKLNQTFKGFCEKVEKLTNQGVEFDSPFRELGFTGVPYRSNCLLQPTSFSLVNLIEWPPFVVTLDEVELVHFERVSFQLKNFDMVFIFRDYSRKVEMVQQIPMSSLDNVKEWLDSCEIRYTEGVQSLNWSKVMKTIMNDPHGFFAEGGWNFLDTDQTDDEDEEGSEEDEDEYKESESSASAGSDDSDGSEDLDAGQTSESDRSGEEEDVGSDEESGKDWSDLEEEAAKADEEKMEFGDDDVDRRKRKRKSNHNNNSSPPPRKKQHRKH